MSARHPLMALAVALLLAGCGQRAPHGPVRTPMRAGEIAQQTLRAAGLDEAIVDVRREEGAWMVVTRWRESSVAGHLVWVDAATGRTRVERYRSVELAPPPR
jgi:hypothetical protein